MSSPHGCGAARATRDARVRSEWRDRGGAEMRENFALRLLFGSRLLVRWCKHATVACVCAPVARTAVWVWLPVAFSLNNIVRYSKKRALASPYI